jgi:deoxyribose-phosphate aldolase
MAGSKDSGLENPALVHSREAYYSIKPSAEVGRATVPADTGRHGGRLYIDLDGITGLTGFFCLARTKLTEAEQLLADGAQEMDLMINVGMLRSDRLNYVEDEIKAIVQLAGDVEVKVILEVHCLTDDEIKKACELCIKAGAAFVKTSTGWMPTGATLETVSLISNFVGNAIEIKASGGIRDLNTLAKMYAMGVARFGINVQASMDLISACAQLPGGVLKV